jgi:hypothetical protein
LGCLALGLGRRLREGGSRLKPWLRRAAADIRNPNPCVIEPRAAGHFTGLQAAGLHGSAKDGSEKGAVAKGGSAKGKDATA